MDNLTTLKALSNELFHCIESFQDINVNKLNPLKEKELKEHDRATISIENLLSKWTNIS